MDELLEKRLLTFSEDEATQLNTRLYKAMEKDSLNDMLWCMVRHSKPRDEWESKAFKTQKELKTFSDRYGTTYQRQGNPTILTLAEFSSHLRPIADGESAKHFARLLKHLDAKHFVYELSVQSVHGEIDPTLLHKDIFSSFTSAFGHRIPCQLQEYTLVVNFLLTRHELSKRAKPATPPTPTLQHLRRQQLEVSSHSRSMTTLSESAVPIQLSESSLKRLMDSRKKSGLLKSSVAAEENNAGSEAITDSDSSGSSQRPLPGTEAATIAASSSSHKSPPSSNHGAADAKSGKHSKKKKGKEKEKKQ